MFTRLVSPFARSAMDIRFLALDLVHAGGPRAESPERARLRHDDRHPVRQDQWVRAQAGHHGAEGEEGCVAGCDGDPWGGWRAGNKRDCQFIMPDFARKGYVAISPQYRFCPKETFPAQVEDVKAAVRWVKTHAKEHNIDPERLGAVGFSAGGHLSLMLGLTGPADGLEGESSAGAPDSRVKAVVNFFGPTDLAASDIPDASKPLVRDFLGATPQAEARACRQGLSALLRLQG